MNLQEHWRNDRGKAERVGVVTAVCRMMTKRVVVFLRGEAMIKNGHHF